MKINFRKYYLYLFIILSTACVRSVTPPIQQGQPMLVVEGLVTTDSTPYTVKLSYSGKYISTVTLDTNQIFINDAKVVIKDDAGDSTTCNLASPGTYQSSNNSFIGTVGRSYTLLIYLSNGKTYISSVEKINPVPAIDSISVVYDSTYITDIRPTQFIVSVNVNDPASTQNYYRWTATAYVPRKSWGDSCNYPFPECGSPYSCTCFAECEQFTTSSEVNVLSDEFIRGKEFSQPAFYSPIYWFGKHFVEIKQYSLNEDIYAFWLQYLQQTNETGGILDPLPSSLLGNIHNTTDSNDVALGYFETSAVVTKRV